MTADSGDRSPANGSSARPSPPTGRRSGSGSSKRKRGSGAKLFRFDREFGSRLVAGTDEAGRGSLAGPLVAAAVLIDYDRITLTERRSLAWLDDSKRKTLEQREELYPRVIKVAAAVAVSIRSVNAIDGSGLHVSNLRALGDSLCAVARPGTKCLVDGFRLPDCRVEHEAVVDGDARSAAIAAASVIAKVTRDRFMCRADELYPGWGFAGNAGYSTPDHREAISRLGVSPLHRMSFASVAYTQLELAG